MGFNFCKKTVGVIGAGNIERASCSILSGFGGTLLHMTSRHLSNWKI